MTLKEFRDIALHAAKGTAPENFSLENVNDAFVDGLKELAGTYNQFMKNRYDIYDIIIEAVDSVLPKNVIDSMGAFAEVKQVAQGEKAMFKRKLGRQRAKKFLTQVGLSGVYETFRLDSETFEVSAHAVGGGATIDFERMLDGAESLSECIDIITEGLTNAVFKAVCNLVSLDASKIIPPLSFIFIYNKFIFMFVITYFILSFFNTYFIIYIFFFSFIIFLY